MREGQIHRPEPAPPLWPKFPPIPHPLKYPHQRLFGAVIKFQTTPNQQKVKAWTNNLPPITTVTSRRRPVLAQTMMTHIMYSRAKIRLRAQTTVRNSRQPLKKLCKCTIKSTQRSIILHPCSDLHSASRALPNGDCGCRDHPK